MSFRFKFALKCFHVHRDVCVADYRQLLLRTSFRAPFVRRKWKKVNLRMAKAFKSNTEYHSWEEFGRDYVIFLRERTFF